MCSSAVPLFFPYSSTAALIQLLTSRLVFSCAGTQFGTDTGEIDQGTVRLTQFLFDWIDTKTVTTTNVAHGVAAVAFTALIGGQRSNAQPFFFHDFYSFHPLYARIDGGTNVLLAQKSCASFRLQTRKILSRAHR